MGMYRCSGSGYWIRTSDQVINREKRGQVTNINFYPYSSVIHDCATVMLENGEDILWVSNMLGHTDWTMTLSRYARYVKRKERKRGQFLHQELALKDTE